MMWWRVQVIVAWSFRIFALVVTGVAFVALFVLGIYYPGAFNAVYYEPWGGLGFGFALVGLFSIFELLGSVLSGNQFFGELPRFGDRWPRE